MRWAADAGSTLAHRLRRWPTTEPAPTKQSCLTELAHSLHNTTTTTTTNNNNNFISRGLKIQNTGQKVLLHTH